jgi:hypothetical protein
VPDAPLLWQNEQSVPALLCTVSLSLQFSFLICCSQNYEQYFK